MGLSLQEQLLKAGLVNKKQLKKAEHDKRVQNKKKKKAGVTTSNAATNKLQQQQSEQAKLDRKLNVERRELAQRKADQAAAQQMIKLNQLALEEGDVVYHYVDGGQIKRILVSQNIADKLSEGAMGLAVCQEDIVLISDETVIKVLKRDKDSILAYNDPTLIEDDYPTDW
ncbi:MAG: DUF2058 family protein [Thermodesulfobacteriota bacterium]|nr:DUF2058 family protein [Thermodesulfobacteriota bacterium]